MSSEIVERADSSQVRSREDFAVAANSPMGMMMAALQQGADLTQIEKMMDLQERWQRGEAKKAYDTAFAAFKAEGVTILKGRKVTDGPLKGKSYAELHDVVNAVTSALSRHGLSSSWKLTKDERDWIEVTCYLRHTGGHEESVSMGGPPDTGGAKNAIQARASSKTYLERYTLKAILGLSEEEDDNDGNSSQALDDWYAKIDEAASLDDLESIKRAGADFFTKRRDVTAFRHFQAACMTRTKALREVGNA